MDKDTEYKTIPLGHIHPGASLVNERSCRNALEGSRHLQERSRSFCNPSVPTALS